MQGAGRYASYPHQADKAVLSVAAFTCPGNTAVAHAGHIHVGCSGKRAFIALRVCSPRRPCCYVGKEN